MVWTIDFGHVKVRFEPDQYHHLVRCHSLYTACIRSNLFILFAVSEQAPFIWLDSVLEDSTLSYPLLFFLTYLWVPFVPV